MHVLLLSLGTAGAIAALAGAAGCSSSPGEDRADASSDDATVGCNLAFCPLDAAVTSDAPIELPVKETIDHICAGSDCHGNGAGGMAVSVGNEFTEMVDVVSLENRPMLRVKPFDPTQSYLYRKLQCEGGISGACMPGGNPSSTYTNLFRAWIEAGAPTD